MAQLPSALYTSRTCRAMAFHGSGGDMATSGSAHHEGPGFGATAPAPAASPGAGECQHLRRGRHRCVAGDRHPEARTCPQSPWVLWTLLTSEPLRTGANLSQQVLQLSPENARDRGARKGGHLPQTPHLPLLTNGGFLQTPRPSRDFRRPFQRAGPGAPWTTLWNSVQPL